MTGLKRPNGELVGQAWIAANTGIPAGRIASTLPDPNGKAADHSDGWAAQGGFLQVRSLPGGPMSPDLPHRRVTVLQADAWGTRVARDAFRPVWGDAMGLMEALIAATFPGVQSYGKPVAMPVAGYLDARVLAAYPLGEPTRVEDDPSGFARMMLNLSITWTV